MPIQTSTLITVTAAERDRVNAELVTLTQQRDDARQTSAAFEQALAQRNGRISELEAQIAALQAELATRPPASATPVMRISGRQLLDAAGRPWTPRGIEMILGSSRGPGAGAAGGVTDLLASAAVNANAFRPNKFIGLTDDQILAIFDRIRAVGMVPFVTYPESVGLAWLGRANVKARLQAHRNLVIDGLLEDSGGSGAPATAAWKTQAIETINLVRSWGYKHPISLHSTQFGRNLRNILVHGADLIAADPEHNLLLGCQMYWGSTGWDWAAEQGFGARGTNLAGTREAFRQIQAAPFPVLLGFKADDQDGGSSGVVMPYATQLELARVHGCGWLWWDWNEVETTAANPKDALTIDYLSATTANLTAAGKVLVQDHADGFRTASKATGF